MLSSRLIIAGCSSGFASPMMRSSRSSQRLEGHGLREARIHRRAARASRSNRAAYSAAVISSQPSSNHAQEKQQRPQQRRRASNDVTRAVKVEQRARAERQIGH